MYAIRQVIDDPQDVIAVPPELRHRRTEVTFVALDQEPASPGDMTVVKALRVGWFDGYQPEADEEPWATTAPLPRKLGLGRQQFTFPENFDNSNAAEIAGMFELGK
jgi:hypothetical protein